MLVKEDLVKLGLSEENADKVLEQVNKEYVPSYRYKEVKDSLDCANAEITKRDKQIDGLKKHSGNKEELEAEITRLKDENKKAKEEAAANLIREQKENAITEYLYGQKVKNIGAIKKLLDSNTINFEDNKLTGIDEQIRGLREDSTLKSLFEDVKFQGADPNIPNGNKPKEKGLFDDVINRGTDEQKFNPWA